MVSTGNNIGLEGAIRISEALMNNSSLTILILGSNFVVKKSVEWKKLEEWIGNNIREGGARAIGESLKANTSLTKLNLRG